MTSQPLTATTLGSPRIGPNRELKRATEGYWAGRTSRSELESVAATLRRDTWTDLASAGLDSVPVNTFSYYDQMLDTAVMLGALPARAAGVSDELDRYFALARGNRIADIAPLEMTKWFDTNYHYLVPEIGPATRFTLNPAKVLSELKEALALGIPARPVIIGPVTFLLLSKGIDGAGAPIDRLEELVPVYSELLSLLAENGARWVQLDEPALVTDMSPDAPALAEAVYNALGSVSNRPGIFVATYFGDPGASLGGLARTPVDAIGVRPGRRPRNPDRRGAGAGRQDAGGRSRGRAQRLAHQPRIGFGHAGEPAGFGRVRRGFDVVLDAARALFPKTRNRARRQPSQLVGVRRRKSAAKSSFSRGHCATDATRSPTRSRRPTPPWPPVATMRGCTTTGCATVRSWRRARTAVTPARAAPSRRSACNCHRCRRPRSAPTRRPSAIRKARAAFRAGEIDEAEYVGKMKREIADVIALQEELGLDVLVHGEPERNDMVQYFAEQLEGFFATQNGWVQSYGSRCVRAADPVRGRLAAPAR